jgi:7-keto-8-aminopelargonate synthetase-like enzyme
MRDEMAALTAAGLWRPLGLRESPPVAGMIQLDGVQYINFGSSDYLGLAASEPVVSAVMHFVGQLGWGSGSSPLISGRGALQRRLEDELADFLSAEAALIFPTRFAANVGTISSLAREAAIFVDESRHPSIDDGCLLSDGAIHIYRHNDVDHLSALMKSEVACRRKLVVAEGLSGSRGDFAPLNQLVELAEQFNAMLLVDEAHSLGLFGECGRGACERLGVTSSVDVRTGSLDTSLGGFGGFVAGSEGTIQWIASHARPYMFSAAPPDVMAAASLAALEIIRTQPERRDKLICNAERLRGQLQEHGFDVEKTISPVISIPAASVASCRELHDSLKRLGCFVPALQASVDDPGDCWLRISVSTDHTPQHFRALINALNHAAELGGLTQPNWEAI